MAVNDTCEGAIVVEGKMPEPWPPASSILIVEQHGVQILGCPDGRFRLYDAGVPGAPFLLGETCPVEVYQHREFALAVTWADGGEFGAAINGTLLASIDDGTQLQDKYVVAERIPRRGDNYADRNAGAVTRRRDRYAGYQLYPHRVRLTEAEIAAELASGLRQLRHFLELVAAGDTDHIQNLANLIRKLVCTGTPLPHLQLVAAPRQLPLIVYTEHSRKDMTGAAEEVSLAIWPQPTDTDDNPIDIDVWLDLPGGRFAGNVVTHRFMLTKIGDNIGAHFDMDMHLAVAMLRGSASKIHGTRQSFLFQYLVQVARTLAALIEQTLLAIR